MAPTTPKGKFTEGEKVLCYHGPLLYEAKCVKIKKDGAGLSYLVHYLGWNKNWDEWVNESRILKITSETLDKKTKLQASVSASKDKKKTPKLSKKSKSGTDSANTSRASTPVSDRSFKGATPGPQGGSGRRNLDDDLQSSSSREDDREREPRRKKMRNSTSNSLAGNDDFDESDEPSESGFVFPEVDERGRFSVKIPEELRYVLVSDLDLVRHSKSLFNLPAKMTVNAILTEFKKHAEKTGYFDNNVVGEMMNGVRDFFDATIGRQLLYNIERPQFQTIVKQEDKKPSDIYGSAHLLRLMTKIGDMLNQTPILEESGIKLIENILGQFLDFLDSNRTKFFTSKNYSEATDEYMKSVEPAP